MWLFLNCAFHYQPPKKTRIFGISFKHVIKTLILVYAWYYLLALAITRACLKGNGTRSPGLTSVTTNFKSTQPKDHPVQTFDVFCPSHLVPLSRLKRRTRLPQSRSSFCGWLCVLVFVDISAPPHLHFALAVARSADRRKLYRSLQNLAAVANAAVTLVPLHDIEPAYFKIYLAHVVKYLG